MVLWIVSQDGLNYEIANKITAKGNQILVNNEVFGTYKNEIRTIQILQDIRKFMTLNSISGNSYEDADLKIKSIICSSLYRFYGLPTE